MERKSWPQFNCLRKLVFLLLVLFVASSLRVLKAQGKSSNLGVFESHSDVGETLHPGSVTYDAAQQSYTLRAAGENVWLKKDAFFFVWKKTSGDVALSADIRFPHEGHNPHRKAMLLLRQDLAPDAVYADAALHGAGLTALQYRPEKGQVTGDIELNFDSIADAPSRLRIEKRGNHVSMSIASHGEMLHPSGAATIVSFSGDYYVGLGLCSHEKDITEEAIFSNVVLESLQAVAAVKQQVRSTLETMSVDPSARRATLVYTAGGHFEAPNWTRDNKALIFDQGGKMMRVAAGGGKPEPIDTGPSNHCNGSHGLSPDGKWLAISCNPDMAGGAPGQGSRVYIIPSTGGSPRVVTENPQSYFHSWSPDGKTIAFTRPHTGGGDIFSISVDGGAETRLTTSDSISDDPDYSPDGQYIYFNSNRAGDAAGNPQKGSMQIWRMHPDGSHAEQITSDERNNWTPHISPDGKSMVYISYSHGDTGHPSNKDISLRILTLDSKQVRTLVDLVGGSGTMNVSSWAPDSHNVAYVSYELINDGTK